MLLRYFLKGLLLPPASLLLLMLAGVLLRRRWPRLGPLLALAGFLLLWGLSLPWTAQALRARLESVPPLDPQRLAGLQAGAIVVLSAGRYLGAPEYGGQARPDAASLQRLEYAAWLARRTGLPVIASGGAVLGEGESAAALMAAVLRDDYGLAQVQAETASQTTWENARAVRALFPVAPPPRVLLVTQAWHMPRAVWSFEANGFSVVAAPTRFGDARYHALGVLRFLPQAAALADSSLAIHEWLGLWVYRRLY